MISLKTGPPMALATALLIVLIIMLVAAFWPFNPFPANNVVWLKGRNGLEFGRNPIVLSRSPLNFTDARWSSISVEMCLQPADNWTGKTFLSIYTPENPKQFYVMQYHSLVIVRRTRRDANGLWEVATIGAEKTISADAPLFLTITSGPKGSSMYFNGKLARVFPGYSLSGSDLSGQLIFGTSPFERQAWHGEWRGLAIYGAELSSDDVLAHYQKWMDGQQAVLAQGLVPTTLYDFHEGTGKTIRDLTGAAPDLFIPKHYSVPHKPMLQWPWEEYQPTRSYAEDVAVNVAGFVPFGFLLGAFLWCCSRSQKPVLTTILIGALLSFTIEFLQAYIPQRSSGMTDIITNTLGTAIGAVFSGQQWVKDMFVRLGLSRQQ
jgi:hypothetical protein